jgi:hypothetical protein
MAANSRQLFRGLRAMPAEPGQPVTELLRAAQAGDADAAERLLAVVYEDLRQLARARMARVPPGQTLQPTALVHEAYLRLADRNDLGVPAAFLHRRRPRRSPRPNLTEQTVREMARARVHGEVSWTSKQAEFKPWQRRSDSQRCALRCDQLRAQAEILSALRPDTPPSVV